MAHARTAGANGRGVYRVKFTDTETGHSWYVGFYTLPETARAYRTRHSSAQNADPERAGKKPVIGVVEHARITSWKEIGDRK